MSAKGSSPRKRHTNDERTVRCPVDGCDATPLARGIHLHVMRSDGNGHGPQGDVPDTVSFENLETVGSRSVTMDYPEHRETEEVARLCPYCERPFRGKQGVLIHLGQVSGRKDHPSELPADLDPEEFPVVHVDDRQNILEVVEGDARLPSTERRLGEAGSDLREKVRSYIDRLREQGKADEAALAEQMLA